MSDNPAPSAEVFETQGAMRSLMDDGTGRHRWPMSYDPCETCSYKAKCVALTTAVESLEAEAASLRTEVERLTEERDGWEAALRGFVDIMREDGHTDLTAEQVHGMVAVVRLSRTIAALNSDSEGSGE